MIVRHLSGQYWAEQEVSGTAAFLLRGGGHDWFSWYPSSQTRNAGWVLGPERIGEAPYKLLEAIEVVDETGSVDAAVSLAIGEHSVLVQHASGTKSLWSMSAEHRALTVRFSAPARFRVLLDTRPLYSYPVDGRRYAKEQASQNNLAISYAQEGTDELRHLHLRVSGTLALAERWVPRTYPRDAARTSAPTELYAFECAEIRGTAVSIGYGTTPELAEQAAAHAATARVSLPGTLHEEAASPEHEAALALAGAARTLSFLRDQTGYWAGLPWFHQVWSRDELIAALGLSQEDQQEVLQRYLGADLDAGQLPTYLGSGTSCADGLTWLLLLMREYGVERLREAAPTRLLRLLAQAYTGLEQRKGAHGLIMSGENATWMDTIGRSGARIEVQCGYSLLLDTLYQVTGEPHWQRRRLRFLASLRQLFYVNGVLRDGLGDETVRPNAFLAYLVEPELLSRQAWATTFQRTLRHCWLPWGGLSSISTQDYRFHSESTGEDNRSYHNGDSWFFVNNLAAVALARFQGEAAGPFASYISEIRFAGAREILWNHMLGHAGEISSANQLESWGCGCQAFSAGSFLFLGKELGAKV